MRSGFCLIPAALLTGIVVLAPAFNLFSQQLPSAPVTRAAVELPASPLPQFALAAPEPDDAQTQAAQSQSPQQQAPNPAPAQPSATQGSSSSQSSAPPSDAEKTQREKAEEQLKAQEHQRVFGVMATFNTTANQNALPLSPKQKFQLFFKSATDPWPFLLAGVVSGVGQADNSNAVWGQGVQGYAKRYGAAYSDAFIGNFFGNAVLPVVLHEDPRYFQKGSGRIVTRFLWAASSTVWCKRDRGGWGPNYSNLGGNLIGSAIARAYYPASERTVSDTITDGLTVSAEGIAGAEVIEFWPDIVRHYKRKHDEKLARAQSAADQQAAHSQK
jgi:hypothetical protein